MLRRCMIGIAVAACLSLSGQVAATPQLHFVETTPWGQSGGGGPFEVDPISFGFDPVGLGNHGAGADAFLTFCLEKQEFIGEGVTYDVAFSTQAEPQGDELDSRTAFLYKHFITGDLDSVEASFVYGAANSGRDLQRAIWFLEGEIGSVSGLAAGLVAAAQAAVDGGSWVGLGGVRVMNLWAEGHLGESGFEKQDQLVLIPIPNAAALGLVGLMAVVFIGRRRF